MGLAFGEKGFLTVFYEISKELQVDIEIGEKGAVNADYTLIQVPCYKTITVFFV